MEEITTVNKQHYKKLFSQRVEIVESKHTDTDTKRYIGKQGDIAKGYIPTYIDVYFEYLDEVRTFHRSELKKVQ